LALETALLSFGKAKERSSPAGRDLRFDFGFSFECSGDKPRVGIRYADSALHAAFSAADGKGIFAWPKIPFNPKGHPDKHGLRLPAGSRHCYSTAGTRDWLTSNRSNS